MDNLSERRVDSLRWQERMEDKLDKLSEAMQDLVRVEEKILNLESDRREVWVKVHKIDEKVDRIEVTVAESAKTVSVLNKLFWTLVASGAAFIFNQAFGIV